MDIAIINGKILAHDKFVEAIGIKDGLIKLVGSNKDILNSKGNAEVIDAKGNLVLPGLNDSHLHLHSLGAYLNSVDCHGVDSISRIIEMGKEFIEKNNIEDGEPVLGTGWNQDYFKDEKRSLNRHDLDKISTTNPIVFRRTCGHVNVCNTKALEILGIDENTEQVEGGYFELEDDGYPSGVFNEKSEELLNDVLPKVTLESVKKNILAASKIASSYGITSVQVGDLSYSRVEYPYILQAYKELEETNELSVRVNLQCWFDDTKTFSEFINQGYKTGVGSDFVKIGPLKLFVDGSLGAKTALLRQPYHDDNSTCGIECMTQSQLDEMVMLADRSGFQVMVHAIGDEAITRVLNSYEKVCKKSSNPLRHGINHCQITDYKMLERFKENDILAYVQPIFLHYDLHIVEDRVGKELAKTSYGFNTMEKLGLNVAYGTDAPIDSFNPYECMYCAVTRKDLTGYPSDGFNISEAVNIETAINRYTTGGAYASFDEDKKGSIEVGKFADIVILNQDLFTINQNDIKNTKAVVTIVDGKVVYRAT